MSIKNKLLTTLILSSSSITITGIINHCIKVSATSRNLLKDSKYQYYCWRFGDIYYKKCGSGKPLLLVHDLHSSSSSHQWDSVISALSKSHTVYTIDLLGCGCSEKPAFTYTNYLFVQLISDFIKSEIGHRTDVVSLGNSGNFIIMACKNTPELFNRVILVNPDSILSCSHIPGKITKLYKVLLDFPIIGTLVYHIAVSKKSIEKSLIDNGFYDPHLIKKRYINICHEIAHLGFSPKSIYASVRCNYANCNIVNALKKIDNSIYLIGGGEIENEKELLKEYTEYNCAIEYILIPKCKQYPQIERPEKFLSVIQTFLS